MRFLITFIGFGLFVALGNTVSQSAEPPNIILISIDGLSRDSVSCYGAKQVTPNIDQLANEGVRYETAWSMPACTPTRVTLLTGQYPFRHGWTEDRDVATREGVGLNWEQFTTVAKRLRDGGYQTAVGGPWQLNQLSKQPDALQQHGFHESCVWNQAEMEQSRPPRQQADAQVLINGKREKAEHKAEQANSFLIDFTIRNRNQPFFIYYTMLLDREPRDKAKRKLDKLPSDKMNQHAESIKRIDQLIGNLIRAIDNNGLREKTLIVLAGNNHPAVDTKLRNERTTPTNNRISDFEVHVPLIVRSVGMVDGERVSHDLIDFSDIYPTFLELADLQPSRHVVLDGKSFAPSLRGSEDPYQKRNWIYSQLGETRMIRDWQHLIDTRGNFHDLQKDPLQEQEISPLDKIAPGRRQRLQMILDRFPKDAASPFRKAPKQHK